MENRQEQKIVAVRINDSFKAQFHYITKKITNKQALLMFQRAYGGSLRQWHIIVNGDYYCDCCPK
jgi:hypothetical protein